MDGRTDLSCCIGTRNQIFWGWPKLAGQNGGAVPGELEGAKAGNGVRWGCAAGETPRFWVWTGGKGAEMTVGHRRLEKCQAAP